jgi:hypothetical protein
MPIPENPFHPRPNVESPVSLPDPKEEDLGEAVPLGEPDDEGYVIEIEDPEYGPPEEKKKKK